MIVLLYLFSCHETPMYLFSLSTTGSALPDLSHFLRNLGKLFGINLLSLFAGFSQNTSLIVYFSVTYQITYKNTNTQQTKTYLIPSPFGLTRHF